MSEDDFIQRLKETQFVVDATSDEMQMLWEKFCDQSMYKTPLNVYKWEQLNPGCVKTLGKLADMPVCMSMHWHRINGIMVMFYEGTSQVVDHRMIDQWIEENVHCKDEDGRLAQCNAANFGHVLRYIRKFGVST